MNTNSVLIWSGESLLDKKTKIGAFLTYESNNEKTGDMPQVAIMALDRSPVEATKDGTDSAICGNCPLRPMLAKETKAKAKLLQRAINAARKLAGLPAIVPEMIGQCYVKVFHGPRAVWQSWRNGNIAKLSPKKAGDTLANHTLRLGSYGDPAAVPVAVWHAIKRYARVTVGYTHQWRTAGLQGLCMASVGNESEYAQAKALGYRTFRTLKMGETMLPGEILCPASIEAGKRTTCVKCGLCNGRASSTDRRKDIAIMLHGGAVSGRKRFAVTEVN